MWKITLYTGKLQSRCNVLLVAILKRYIFGLMISSRMKFKDLVGGMIADFPVPLAEMCPLLSLIFLAFTLLFVVIVPTYFVIKKFNSSINLLCMVQI